MEMIFGTNDEDMQCNLDGEVLYKLDALAEKHCTCQSEKSETRKNNVEILLYQL